MIALFAVLSPLACGKAMRRVMERWERSGHWERLGTLVTWTPWE